MFVFCDVIEYLGLINVIDYCIIIQRPTCDDLLKYPFISGTLDSKPIRDLLLEYKAEVVEEELTDDDPEVGGKLIFGGLPYFTLCLCTYFMLSVVGNNVDIKRITRGLVSDRKKNFW